MAAILQIRSGSISGVTLIESELFFDTDTNDLYIGTATGNQVINSSGSNYYSDAFTFNSATGEITITGPGVSISGSLDGRYLLTSSFEDFTQSFNELSNSFDLVSESFNELSNSYHSASISFDDRIDNLETTFSVSVDARLDALENATSSVSGNYVIQSVFEEATASLSQSIQTKLDSASFDLFSQSYIVTSASFDSRLDAIESGSASGSYLTNYSDNVVLSGTFTGSFVGDGSGLVNLPIQNWFPEDLQFNTSTGILTISGSGMGSLPTSLDGRYLLTSSYLIDSASFAQAITNINIGASGGYSDINFNPLTGDLEFSSSTGVLLVDLDNRYNLIDRFVVDSASFDYRIKNLDYISQSGVPLGTISSSQQISDFGFISSAIYPYDAHFADIDPTSSGPDGGELTIYMSGAADIVVDIDGRYARWSAYYPMSASFDQRINAIEVGSASIPAGTVSSSQQIIDYGIFLTESSATDITQLNQFTESYLTNDSVSFDGRLDDLETWSESLTFTDANYFVTGVNFNSESGDLDIFVSGSPDVSTNLDGRYQLTGSYLTDLPDGIVSTSTQITDFGFISESTDITQLNQFTESIDGRVTDLENWSESLSFTDANYFVTGVDFDDTTGDLTIFVSGASDVSTNLDNRYLTELPVGTLSSSQQIIDYNIFVTESVTIVALNSFTESYLTNDSVSFDERISSNSSDIENLNAQTESFLQNYYPTLLSFNSESGEITVSGSGMGVASESLDGRYQLSGSYLTELPLGIVSTSTQITDFGFISESSATDITALNQFTESYLTNDSVSFDGRLDDLETWSASLTITDENYYATGVDFNNTSGDLSIYISGASDISTNLDGRYLTELPNGLLSSSAQIASDISGAFEEASAGFDGRLDDLEDWSASLTIATENYYADGVTFNDTNGELIISVNGASNISASLDGRYLTDLPIGIVSTSTQITNFGFISESISTDITDLNQFTESYLTNDSVSFDGRLDDLEEWSSSLTITSDNYYATGATFDTNDGNLTIHIEGATDFSVDLDGRYLTELPLGIVSTSTQITDFGFISESVSTDITQLNQFTESYLTNDSVSFDGRLDDLETWSASLTITDENYYATGTLFDTNTGDLTIFISGASDISTSLDGRYLTDLPSGIVSTSTQITDFGFISESIDITALNQFTESYLTNDSVSFDGRLDDLETWSSSLTITSDNYYVTGVNFNSESGELLINIEGSPDVSTSFDGRYQLSGSYLTELPSGLLSSSAQIASDISGAFEEASAGFDGRLDDLETWSSSLEFATNNYYSTGTLFDTNTGDLTIFISGAPDISTSLDGRYLTDLPAGLVSSSEQVSDITGSSLVTASYLLNDITFTKGDGSEFTLNLNQLEALSAENTHIHVKNVSGVTIEKGTPLFITGSGTSGNIAGVIPADAGNPTLMPAGAILAEQLLDEAEGVAWVNGFISGVNTSQFESGDTVYVAVGGGYTNEKPTGSALIQKLGNVEKSGTNGSGVINGPGYYNDVPNITEGYVWVGNGDSVATPTSTASFVENYFPTGVFFESESGQLTIFVSGADDISTSLDERYLHIDSYSVDSASFNERLISGSLLSVLSTCSGGVLPPATDVFAIYDATSMELADAESASVALKSWFGEYTASHPDHTGELYILSTGDERYLSYPYNLLNNNFPLGSFTTLHELPSDWGVNFQYPSNSVVLAFVDETNVQYHGGSVNFFGQPTTEYQTDYSNHLTFTSSIDYFSGVLYPIPRDTTGQTAALILQGLAAMKARTLTIDEISASLGDNVTQIDVTILTGSNPYTNPLENVGWQGVFDKSSPAVDVFTSNTFGSELNTLLLGENTEDVVSLVQSYENNTLTIRGLKSSTLNMAVNDSGCVDIEVNNTEFVNFTSSYITDSASFDSRIDTLEGLVDDNYFATGVFFDTGSGDLTIFISGAPDISTSLDDRYSLTDTTYELTRGSAGPNSSDIQLRNQLTGATSSIRLEGDEYITVGDSQNTISLQLDTGSVGNLLNLIGSNETLVTASFTNAITASVNHNFDTVNVLVSVYDNAGYYILPDEILIKSADLLELHFDIPTSGYVVVGKAGHIVSGSSEVDITQLNQFTASYYIDSASFDIRLDNMTAGESLATQSFTNTESVSVSHNFDTKNVLVSVYDSNDYYFIPNRIELIDNNNVEVTWQGNKSGHVVVSKAGHIVNGALPDGVTYNSSIRTLTVNDLQIGRGNSNIDTNTIIGKEVAQTNTTNQFTTAVGYQSQQNNGVGDFNTSFGACSLMSHDGISAGHNTALGYKSMSGSADITGGCNTAVGSLSLADLSGSVACNVAIGYNSGPATSPITGTVSVGYEARARGNDSIAIGRNAVINEGVTNSILIGANTTVSGSNVVKLGNAGNDTYQYYGTSWANPSDGRDKTCVKPLSSDLGLNFVMKLNPVEYRYDYRENYELVCNYDYGKKDGTLASDRIGYGLIAQEVETTLNQMNTKFDALKYDEKLDQYSIGYTELIPTLIKAIQEQQNEINELKAKIDVLENK